MKHFFYFLFVLILIQFTACTSRKKMIYFQGAPPNNDINKNYNPIFKSDDLLFINIIGQDELTVRPFNLPLSNFNNNIGGYTQGTQPPQGYLVDLDGYVDMPIIGKVKIGGLTRTEAIDLLKQKLSPYLQNPTVLIRILNFKVTVLGEVRNPGTFTIPNERITILEALGIAGDLLITAERTNLLVIREIDGKKTEHRVNLTSKDLFGSPVYYLNQNDILYITPNRAKMNSSVINPANAGIVISAVSLIVTVLALLTR